MAKGKSKKLNEAIRAVLEEEIIREPDAPAKTRHSNDPLTNRANAYLIDLGVFEEIVFQGDELILSTIRITAYGREYYEKETTFAPWYWFKRNAFATTVATATIATSVSGIVFNVLD